MGAVGDREIFARGTPESVWQDWGGLGELPVVDAAGLLPAHGRAIVVAPHPDDEILAAAGLMCQLSDRGRDIVIVAVTDGDASHPGSTLWTPENLAHRRAVERLDALQLLGLGRVPVVRLGIPDGKVGKRQAELGRWLDTLLLPTDTVFATWRLDGHPDHEAVGRIAARCCRHAGAHLVELPVWMWHWASPQDGRIPWERAAAISLTDTQLDRKRAAIAAHRTQLEVDPTLGSPPILPHWALERLLRKTEIIFR